MTSIDRRTFIQGAAGASVAACTGGSVDRLAAGSSVVVIGAGFAGIGAAELLLENGMNVELIEASSRIGGRAHTTPLGDSYADLGANWLASDRVNYLRPHAESNELVGAIADFSDSVIADRGNTSPLDLGPLMADLEGEVAGTYVWYKTRRFFGARPKLPSVHTLTGSTVKEHGATGVAFRHPVGCQLRCRNRESLCRRTSGR